MQFETVGLPPAGSTIAVGMSGGVDSTLAALLLQERGCTVVGLTMAKWDGGSSFGLEQGTGGCYGPDELESIERCREFCAEHNIDYHVIDVQDEYRDSVLEYFKAEYRSGRTPNPCIQCNPEIKFGILISRAKKQGIAFDYFCTGHYARLVRPAESIAKLYTELAPAEQKESAVCTEADGEERPILLAESSDARKDQSYFLYRIPQHVLKTVRFVFSGMTKQQVYELARERGLAAAEQKESQDFVPPECFEALFSDMPAQQGDFILSDGTVLGKHRGIQYYTVGQRRGLGVSAKHPLYVRSIDAVHNRIELCGNDGLLCRALEADNWVWAGDCAPKTPIRAKVKIRLASEPADAVIEPLTQNTWRITFDTVQRAVAPGQSAVVYYNHIILGGGVITRGIYE